MMDTMMAAIQAMQVVIVWYIIAKLFLARWTEF